MEVRKIYTIVISFTAMFSIAIASGVRGLLVPSFLQYFEVSNYQIGLLFSLTTAVSVVGAFLTAPLCAKLGYKTSILIGLMINTAAYYLTSMTTSYIWFVLGYCLISLGVTFAATSLNTVITVIKVTFQAVLVNMIHFFFGLGVTFSQKFGGDLIDYGYHWQDFFKGISILYIAAIILTLFVSYPSANVSGVSSKYKEVPQIKYLIAICIALGLYVCAELQTGNWMINFLNQVYGYSEAKAGLYTAVFFGTFSIGRFLGGFIAEKLGYMNSVIGFATTASVLFITGMLLGEKGLWILSCSGLFFSLIFPTVTLYVSNLFPKHKAQAISILSTICNFLSLISSFIIGYLNDFIGTALAFWLIPFCLVSSVILFTLLRKPPILE